MNVTVTASESSTVRRGPRIQLDMSIEEFALYESLRYSGVTGDNDLRQELWRAHDEVMSRLSPSWFQRVRRAAWGSRGDSNKLSEAIRARSR